MTAESRNQVAEQALVDGLTGDFLIVDESPALARRLQSGSKDGLRIRHLQLTDALSLALFNHTVQLPSEFPPLPALHALYLANPVRFARCLTVGEDLPSGADDLRQRVLHLLAVCRDRVGDRVLVRLDKDCADLEIDRNVLFSLGFRQYSRVPDEHLFLFSLSEYKTVPEWLNAKYWAHPERWRLLDGED